MFHENLRGIGGQPSHLKEESVREGVYLQAFAGHCWEEK